MQELLWLLLPVAAASGWIAARRSASRPRDCRPGERSPASFRGLNYLLNEQPDKAIEHSVSTKFCNAWQPTGLLRAISNACRM